MAGSGDENRVTIDGEAYLVTPAGTDRYAVSNSFGEALGYFTLRGKTITTDDYGIAGAPPLMKMGKLWRAARAGDATDADPCQSKMVCEVLMLSTALQPADFDKARAHHAWLRTQAGLKTAFYAHDAATGKAMAVRVWSSRSRMEAHKERTPPEGAHELPSSGTQVLQLVDDI